MSEGWDGVERRADRSREIQELSTVSEGLSQEVSGLRESLQSVDARRKRNLLWLIPLLALTLYGYYDRLQIKELADREHEQSLAQAVGVCAMQNVIRIEIRNFLAEAQNRGFFDEPGDSSLAVQATEARQAFLTESIKRFAIVPCEALVAGEDEGVKIELQYPSTVPVTSVP